MPRPRNPSNPKYHVPKPGGSSTGCRPRCATCRRRFGHPKQKRRHADGTVTQVYYPDCLECLKTKDPDRWTGYYDYKGKPYGYAKYKADVCAFCGFVPVVSAQLAIDHIDGNHKNNDPDNLQTLCHNCHALKTYQARLEGRNG